MAKNHAIFNGTHCAFWDVDAYNLVGIAATEIDNATFLALGDIKLKTDGGYEFTVTVIPPPRCATMAVMSFSSLPWLRRYCLTVALELRAWKNAL